MLSGFSLCWCATIQRVVTSFPKAPGEAPMPIARVWSTVPSPALSSPVRRGRGRLIGTFPQAPHLCPVEIIASPPRERGPR
jgi:hypothetical protein